MHESSYCRQYAAELRSTGGTSPVCQEALAKNVHLRARLTGDHEERPVGGLQPTLVEQEFAIDFRPWIKSERSRVAGHHLSEVSANVRQFRRWFVEETKTVRRKDEPDHGLQHGRLDVLELFDMG